MIFLLVDVGCFVLDPIWYYPGYVMNASTSMYSKVSDFVYSQTCPEWAVWENQDWSSETGGSLKQVDFITDSTVMSNPH